MTQVKVSTVFKVMGIHSFLSAEDEELAFSI